MQSKPAKSTAQLISRTYKLMGNQFQIGIVWEDERKAEALIEQAVDEIKRIEKLLTTFSEDSETAKVNQQAGIKPVEVSDEFFGLIQRCQAISRITQGAFDITYGGLDKSLWNFDQTMQKMPSQEEALQSIHLINYKNIIQDQAQKTIFLKEKGMRIGFGGIGKGYAAEMAKLKLIELGVQNGLVNASGDIVLWGSPPKSPKWSIGIVDPNLKHQIFSKVELTNCAVATSGNYEKFTIIDGKRYSHTIDPKTGFPIRGIKSVTVICNHGELADAMTTPIMVMGVDAGLYMVNQLPDMACIIIDDDDQVYLSKNLNMTI